MFLNLNFQATIQALGRAVGVSLGAVFVLLCSQGCTNQLSSSGAAASMNSTSNLTASQVQLTWNANPGEQQGFYIEQSTNGTTFTQIQNIPDGTYKTNVSVTPGQNYYFRIRGYNQAGTSSYSVVVNY